MWYGMIASKKAAALLSIGFTAFLAVIKLAIGLLSGSLSILAEAADGIIDLVTDGVAYVAVRVSDLPPDDDHPYGHARAENLSALAQTFLITLTYTLVLWQAFIRIVLEPRMPDLSLAVFLVIIVSLLINLARVVALRQAATRLKSQALAASVTNFTADILRSLVVLLALGLILAQPRFELPAWLVVRLDAIAAVAVALFALHTAWKLGKQTVHTLMDGVPYDLNRRLAGRIASLPAVVPDSARVRARFVGSQPFVEVRVGMPRGHSLEEAQELVQKVKDAVQMDLEQASVLVHVEPTRTLTESYITTVYSTAQRLGLRVHHLDIYQLNDEVRVEMDLELPGSMTLAEAHPYSERLESSIAAELPCQVVVAVHLEPRHDQVRPAVRYAPVDKRVREAINTLPDAASILTSETLLTNNGIIVTLHCRFPGTTLLTEVHNAMARMEQDLRRLIPEVVRVQIDPEPCELSAEEGETR